MAKTHLLSYPQVFNNAHPGSWRAHAKFQPFWSKRLLWCLDTHTNIHAYIWTKIYIKMGVSCILLLGPIFIQKFFFFFFFLLFFALHTNGKWCSQEKSCLCYSLSQFVYAYHVLSLSLQGFVWPNTIFGFFLGLTWTQKWVWSYTFTLKISPIILIPNIYGFMHLTP